MDDERLTLYYTFGNHMHWVDMEWLWGYAVLPDSLRDMLYFCRESGARGNLNFDGVGYEKLAVEAPDALAELRAALQAGTIEIAGASYGQPYGLFHGGESNLRQRVYGVRSVMRLLGVRPRSFWEEEFDFFPQLPQLLRGCGYEYASLFFQWTWHTPSLPMEELPAIWWEGMDGSQLLAAPRNALNLHQWPEDFTGLLESPLLRQMPVPGILQWLELMPSPDWMCRAELLLPQLRALQQHPAFELRCVTLSQYLERARPYAETRRYTLDDVFHGMSLGKNGDRMRRLSRQGEQDLLAAESLSALAGMLGRPYPSWDVYPVWELEEAWRELLAAQHHDNDECEGLCGFIGLRSYQRSLGLSEHVLQRSLQSIADRSAGQPGRTLVYNPLGWSRDTLVVGEQGDMLLRDLPPFGYQVLDQPAEELVPPRVDLTREGERLTLRRGDLAVSVDIEQGLISQLSSADFPDGLLSPDRPLLRLAMTRNGQRESFARAQVAIVSRNGQPAIRIVRLSADGQPIELVVSLAAELDALDVAISAGSLPRPDGGMHSALHTSLAINLPGHRLIHDHPYGLSEIEASGSFLRKYPTGDWMTSPQVFEQVERPFTALQLLDLASAERGLLCLHDGSQSFWRDEQGVQQILSMYDPWDEDYFDQRLAVRLRLVPHGALSHARRWRLAQEFTRPALITQSQRAGGTLPQRFGPLRCDTPGVALSALLRETAQAGAQLERYAGSGMEHPYVLRLVELDGRPASASLLLAGEVAAAWRANLLGEPLEQLAVATAGPPADQPASAGLAWSQVELSLRPYEIATLYLDLVLGRKQARNLDDYRSVWATVHRV